MTGGLHHTYEARTDEIANKLTPPSPQGKICGPSPPCPTPSLEHSSSSTKDERYNSEAANLYNFVEEEECDPEASVVWCPPKDERCESEAKTSCDFVKKEECGPEASVVWCPPKQGQCGSGTTASCESVKEEKCDSEESVVWCSPKHGLCGSESTIRCPPREEECDSEDGFVWYPSISGPCPVTQTVAYYALSEEVHPPKIMTVGRTMRLVIVHLDIDREFFSRLSHTRLALVVGLRDADNDSNKDSALELTRDRMTVQGPVEFGSKPPQTLFDNRGRHVLRFRFYISSLRVREQGSYRFQYSADVPHPSVHKNATIRGNFFVTDSCPDFVAEEVEYLEEEERNGQLRVHWDKSPRQIDVLA